jgi:cell division protein FtsB/nitrate reductase NapE component
MQKLLLSIPNAAIPEMADSLAILAIFIAILFFAIDKLDIDTVRHFLHRRTNEEARTMLKRFWVIMVIISVGFIFGYGFQVILIDTIQVATSLQYFYKDPDKAMTASIVLHVVAIIAVLFLAWVILHVGIRKESTTTEKDELTKTLKELASANSSVADTNKELYKRLDKLSDKLDKR